MDVNRTGEVEMQDMMEKWRESGGKHRAEAVGVVDVRLLRDLEECVKSDRNEGQGHVIVSLQVYIYIDTCVCVCMYVCMYAFIYTAFKGS
jgi:hypothetical protein